MSHSIIGVEVFKTGTWNGISITDKDLDSMIDSFSRLGFRPPLKAGHVKDSPGLPALGFVSKLYKSGKSLFADFVDIPSKVFEAIKARRYDTVSIEVYDKLERNGELFDKALKAIALLGADIPAVDLKPLHEVVFTASETLSFAASINFNLEEENIMPKELEEALEENKKLHAQVKQFEDSLTAMKAELEAKTGEVTKFSEQEKTITELKTQLEASDKSTKELLEKQRQFEISEKAKAVKLPALKPCFVALYDVASQTNTVLKFENADKKITEHSATEVVDKAVEVINKLVAKYFSEDSLHIDAPVSDDPTEELDAKIKAYAAEHKMDYTEALPIVLTAHPELEKAYNAAQH